MTITLTQRLARERYIETDRADRLAMQTRFAVTQGSGRAETCWSPFYNDFVRAPLGLNLMGLERAEGIVRQYGGTIVELVVRDAYGPCCYRLENAP